MEEIWKRIYLEGQESNYEISNLGRCRNTTRLTWKTKGILTPKFNKANGYCSYGLSINNNKCYRYIHRLVAEYFIERIEGKEYVNHIDGNKRNNIVTNLEWVDSFENMKHCFNNDLCSTVKGVILYTLTGEKVGSFPSITKALLSIGVKRGNALNTEVINTSEDNIYKQSYGFQWRLNEGDNRKVIDISKQCKLSEIPVVQLTPQGEKIREFATLHEAYLFLGKIDNGAISMVCKKKRNIAFGYKWMYFSDWYKQEAINKEQIDNI